MGTRAVRGAGRWRAWRVGQPVRPCLSRSPGRLRAKPARSAAPRSPRGPPGLARGENCGPRCSITVAPSRWRLPAQAASAKSEAQRGGHGGWRTAWATRGDAACRAAWLGKHLGSLEAPRSGIAPSGRLSGRHLHLPAPTCTYLRLPCNRLYKLDQHLRATQNPGEGAGLATVLYGCLSMRGVSSVSRALCSHQNELLHTRTIRTHHPTCADSLGSQGSACWHSCCAAQHRTSVALSQDFV